MQQLFFFAFADKFLFDHTVKFLPKIAIMLQITYFMLKKT
jgi:hypothetical protein